MTTRRTFTLVAVLASTLVLASLLLAQSAMDATLRSPSGEAKISVLQLGGQTFVSAEDAATALGGRLESDAQGYRMTVGGRAGAFAPDSQYGVVRDDLIEMPVAPVVVDGRPFVPWQFLQGFLRGANLEVSWDPQSRLLEVRPRSLEAISAKLSVVQVDDLTKVVVELSGKSEYRVVRDGPAYVIQFENPITAPFAGEQTYENPHLARVTFRRQEIVLRLTSGEIAGSSYGLDDPFRVVLDLRKGVAPIAPGPGAPPLRPSDVPGIRTIVLDPGHGGKEVGAIGANGLQEKDATLLICRKLQEVLSRRLGARVLLTRSDDELVPLAQRTAMANQYQADLFLSVHLNASLARGAKGSETYFLSLDASDEAARQAAERENSASTPAPASPSSDLSLILWDLAQQKYLKESSRFAETVQLEMSAATGTENRGVKQAPFRVLVGATMPAALVEVGFISNPEEEARLRDAAFIDSVVNALAGAIEKYKRDYETRIGVLQPQAPAAATTGEATGTSAEAPRGEE